MVEATCGDWFVKADNLDFADLLEKASMVLKAELDTILKVNRASLASEAPYDAAVGAVDLMNTASVSG